MKKHLIGILIAFPCLIGGVLIYAISRPRGLYINLWLSKLISPKIDTWFHSGNNTPNLPEWFIYSLPDALWMLTLMLIILMIWNFRLNRKSIPWISLAFVTGISFEFLQAFHIVRGTFDAIDLAFIIAGGLIPVSITLLNFTSCKTS